MPAILFVISCRFNPDLGERSLRNKKTAALFKGSSRVKEWSFLFSA